MSGESQPWASSGRSRFTTTSTTNTATGNAQHVMPGTVGESIGSVFDRDRKNSLPMYKDKPYAYPNSQRRSVWLQQRWRLLAVFTLTFLAFFYWLGVFSSESTQTLSHRSRQHPALDHVKGRHGSSSTKSGGRKPAKSKSKPNWAERRETVRQVMKESWAGYEKYAWGYDEYHPVKKKGKYMVKNGMGWIIVDALDTLILMNLTTELQHARKWISTKLNYDVKQDVSVFETTIRMLGGLLSAHYLSTEFPNMAPVSDKLGDDLYLEKATDLAGRLLGAFNSTSGIPYASVHLREKEGIPSMEDDGASSTAEATTVQLEMKYLSKLTGETAYWETVEKVMQVVDDLGAEDGLAPIFLHPEMGTYVGENIRLGSRGDSYYEYLIKQYLQTSLQEPVYLEMWEQAMAGIQKHLITYSQPSKYMVIAERPNGLENPITPKMDHLVCFMPGTIALGATLGLPLSQASKLPSWSAKQEREMLLARELTKTCVAMYKYTSTGLAPEIMYFHLGPQPYTMLSNFGPDHALPSAPTEFDGMDEGVALDADDEFSPDGQKGWRQDFHIHVDDTHNLQRPETVETLFYMWRITGDEIYREWGWDIFEAFVEHTRVDGDAGYSSVENVRMIPPGFRNNMESFWMAETLKYFYLLFGPDDVLPLDKVVFNTEAHPFPRFELGKLFKTGWKRKPRRKDGNLLVRPDPPTPEAAASAAAAVEAAGGRKVRSGVAAAAQQHQLVGDDGAGLDGAHTAHEEGGFDVDPS